MLKLFNIKTKLFAIILIILIPIIIFQCIDIKSDFDSSIQNQLQSNTNLAQAMAYSFLSYIEQIWIKEADISTYILSNPDMSSQQISQYLSDIMKNQKTIQTLTWISPEGTVIASSRKEMINVSLNYRKYVTVIQNGADRYLSNLVVSIATDTPILPITRGIRKNGKLEGIMLAVVNIEKYGDQLSSLKFNKGDRIRLVDANGTVVYRNDTSNIYLKRQKLWKGDPAWEALDGKLITMNNAFCKVDNTPKMGVEYPVKEIGWVIGVNSRYDVVLKDDYISLRNSIITLICVLLFSLFIAYIISKDILIRVDALRYSASIMASGNYTVRTNIKGNDEVAVTAQAFDKMAESIEQHDLIKTQFFSNISHELKTPINVIFATAQLLLNLQDDTNLTEYKNSVQKYMKIVNQNCYRLIRLINNLIDITRFENGFLKPSFTNQNIVKLVEDITMSIVKYGDLKGITIIFDTETEEKVISCDPDMIERIILNLISNAIKFTEPGGNIKVEIYDRNDRVLISIKDTGIGIPQDKLDIIFERFKQIDNSLNRKHEGSGIGLSLVKSFVEAHNGEINIYSIFGEGTEITIDLPVNVISETNKDTQKIKNTGEELIERANIEFSDIYFNSYENKENDDT